MTLYHVYVHYKDKGNTKRKMQADLEEEQVRKQVAIPYMKNKRFFFVGKVIYPSDVVQILVYASEKPTKEYILPNGKSPNDEDDIFYIAKCFSKKIEGISLCTPDFITSPPEKQKELIGTPTITVSNKTKVFVVHGRDETQALRLQKYMTKTLNVDAEIFEDFRERSGSKTIIEQLEYIQNEVGYTFVIVTPDDLGCLREDFAKCRIKMLIGKENIKVENICKILEKFNSRARQNVVFEHGLFIGALGRDRVCCLLQKDTKEKPSDIDGVLYVSFSKSVKETFPEITEKLKNAGLVKT